MLLECPECGLQVSDKASICPHCGYPLKNKEPIVRTSRTNRRRRLPNGFGQISEIKNRNLRKPFRAMVSIGKDLNGKPISKPLQPDAYFETYNDAYAALVEYHKNPCDMDSGMLVKDLYEQWSAIHFQKLKNRASRDAVRNAWDYCSAVYNMRAVDLRARHIKDCMENGIYLIHGEPHTPSATMQNKIKSLFNLMLDYAVEYELVDRNCSRTFKLSPETIHEIQTVKREHSSFSDEDMKNMWAHVNDTEYVDLVLIQCYSGWRPQELGLIELKNVDLTEWSFSGGMKTKAGENRKVPIHEKIKGLVKKKYDEAESLGSKYLLNFQSDAKNTNHSNYKLTYTRYKKAFEYVRDILGLDPIHTPHDGRKHFVTTAKKCGVDEYAIKYMVGHNISDITEKVYTDREFSWLVEEMNKIE